MCGGLCPQRAQGQRTRRQAGCRTSAFTGKQCLAHNSMYLVITCACVECLSGVLVGVAAFVQAPEGKRSTPTLNRCTLHGLIPHATGRYCWQMLDLALLHKTAAALLLGPQVVHQPEEGPCISWARRASTKAKTGVTKGVLWDCAPPCSSVISVLWGCAHNTGDVGRCKVPS